MPILYETYSLPARRRSAKRRGFQTQVDYNLLDPEVARPPLPTDIGFGIGGSGCIRKDTFLEIFWDERKTTLHAALLKWTAHSWRGIGSVSAMEARFYVNDVLVSSRGWSAFEGGCITKGNPLGLSIRQHMKQGTNKFSLVLCRSWELPTSGIDSIRAHLVAQFTGEEPVVKPPPTAIEEALGYVKWGIAGAVILGSVYFGTKAVAEWRRRKK